MSAAAATPTLLDGDGVEVKVEAAAGVDMTNGRRWFGTRVYWRLRPARSRRWDKALLVDVHPFDEDVVAAFVAKQVGRP